MLSPAILSRTFDRIKPVMYHGTNSSNFDSLIKGIITKKSNRRTDFGSGFYLTSDFDQASEQANNKSVDEGDSPIVFVYRLNMQNVREKFKHKMFVKMNEEWAEFIHDNRSRLFQKFHNYDYVFGGVADGKLLFDLLDELDNVKMNHEEINFTLFLESIAKYSYDQLSLHNQEIISEEFIQLIEVVYAYDARTQYVGTKAV